MVHAQSFWQRSYFLRIPSDNMLADRSCSSHVDDLSVETQTATCFPFSSFLTRSGFRTLACSHSCFRSPPPHPHPHPPTFLFFYFLQHIPIPNPQLRRKEGRGRGGKPGKTDNEAETHSYSYTSPNFQPSLGNRPSLSHFSFPASKYHAQVSFFPRGLLLFILKSAFGAGTK